MIIAHVDTERSWRGGEQQAFSLIRTLSESGHRNIVFARPGAPFFAACAREGWSVFPCAPRGEWDVFAAASVRRVLRRNNVDVVHAHTAHAAAVAALGTCGTPIPYVASRRVDFPISRNPFSRWKYRRAARIIAVSEGVRRVLRKDKVAEEQIAVVPSGVDFKRFEGVQPVSREALGVPAGAVLIGQVAALADHKDQPTFVRAIGRLRRAGVEAVGLIVGEGESRGVVESAIQQEGLQRHVTLLGFRADPLHVLAAFDIFCLSSKLEGLGTSVLDAMALRIPVVATRTGGIPEMVVEGETGYLAEPGDPESLANALERARVAARANSGLLDRAFEKALSFNVTHTTAGTERIYADACEGRKTHS